MKTVIPAQSANAQTARTRADAPERDYASASVPRHLVRGAVGFGLIAGSIALTTVVGPVALLVTPLALIAFRGCPTCWLVGLAQTISRGRLHRQCVDGVCTLTQTPTTTKVTNPPSAQTSRPVPGHRNS
ncbi:hypothetical protein [Streptomyces sp. NPDC000983]|uniref:hypothetical protein n=1 Tax=Streptomyces sp. NPDC000983 TaxID=3154373 RepID=UPI003332CDB6